MLTAIYDATVGDNRELSQLFNGNKDSTIYQQLFYSYKIYKFVKDRKREDIKREEFVAHASELISYGMYKKLQNNLNEMLSPIEIEKTYIYVLDLIRNIVKAESDKYKKEDREFSFNNYFKNKKCRVDYNKTAKIAENNNVIDLLLSEP